MKASHVEIFVEFYPSHTTNLSCYFSLGYCRSPVRSFILSVACLFSTLVNGCHPELKLNRCPQRVGNWPFMAVTYSKPCFSEESFWSGCRACCLPKSQRRESHQPKHHHLHHQVLLLSTSQFFGFLKEFLKVYFWICPRKLTWNPKIGEFVDVSAFPRGYF